MVRISKWVEAVQADGRVADAALVSLEARLAAVVYWLPLAARQLDDDAEKVHQLRVSTRRAIAALELYRDWLPRRPMRWISKRLKKIRRAAGAARDLDVLAARLRDELGDEGFELLSVVAQRRVAAQPKIVAIAEKCAAADRFGRKMGRLLSGVRPRGHVAKTHDVCFRDWAALELGQSAEQFFAAMPDSTDDLEALHAFRIQGKRLRYTLELVAPAFGPSLREVHYPVVQQLQGFLGKINDCVAGEASLRELRADVQVPAQQELLDRLIQRQRHQLDDALAEYRHWWTEKRAAELRDALATLASTLAPASVGQSAQALPESPPAVAEPAEQSGVGQP